MIHTKDIKSILPIWIIIVFVVTLLFGVFHIGMQQLLRMGANDPQIQMAEDAAKMLSADHLPQGMLIAGRVDMQESLAPFIIVFNSEGKQIASNGYVQNTIPIPPAGVFVYTKQKGEDRFTWQPQDNVRIAAVLVRHEGTHPGFVLAGRSLREVEKREEQQLELLSLGWLGTVVGSFMLLVFMTKNKLLKRE